MQWEGPGEAVLSSMHVTFVAGGKIVGTGVYSALEVPGGFDQVGAYAWLDDGSGPALKRRRPVPPGVVSCSGCGLTWDDFQREGRLGCGHCWETFGTQLAGELRALHRGAHHVGKQPRRASRTAAS